MGNKNGNIKLSENMRLFCEKGRSNLLIPHEMFSLKRIPSHLNYLSPSCNLQTKIWEIDFSQYGIWKNFFFAMLLRRIIFQWLPNVRSILKNNAFIIADGEYFPHDFFLLTFSNWKIPYESLKIFY